MRKFEIKKVAIGIVVKSYPPVSEGGGIISCKLLVDALMKKGLKVSVLTFDGDKLSDAEEDKIVTRVRYLKKRINLKKVKTIKNLYEFWEILKFSKNKDLLHFYGYHYVFSSPFVKIIFRRKMILTLNHYVFNYPNTIDEVDNNNFFYFNFRRVIDSIGRYVINTCFDKIVVLSSPLRKLYVNLKIKFLKYLKQFSSI